MTSNKMHSASSQKMPVSGPLSREATQPHPAGRVKHGEITQVVRMVALTTWFLACAVSTHATQLLGSPLYFINQNYYYAYMALTKQSFGLLMTTLSQWFNPIVIRVSGDKSVRGQLSQTKDGRLQTDFPERLVMMANHQIYIEWSYLWWVAYTSKMHGHIYILLKESLKYIPIIGPGMIFYGFIFLARNWTKDKPRMQHRLKKLSERHGGPLSGSQSLDPMWLLIFPEGTNLSPDTKQQSQKWADKQGIKNPEHVLLPRSTGLQYCLQELAGTVDWLYDCTIAYEGVPRQQFGQDIFTLRAMFLQGRPPKSVNMYWRRIAISDIPINDPKQFESWLVDQWRTKDDLIEHYIQNGRFPADDGQDPPSAHAKKGAGFIETEVKLAHTYEVGQIFVVLAACALVANILAKIWNLAIYGNLTGRG